MLKSKGSLLFALCLLASTTMARNILTLEKGWKFHLGDLASAMSPALDDRSWQDVRVPHDWAIYGPFDKEVDKQVVAIEQNGETIPTEKTGRSGALPWIGVGWYRLNQEIPDYKDGKRVVLLIEGAMSNPIVYVNGHKAGNWAYGYSSFHLDITPWLKEGEAMNLAIRLENAKESSRWYPGAGLYRNVRLIVTESTAIDVWGSYITTPTVTEEEAKVRLQTRIVGAVSNMRLETVLNDLEGNTYAKAETNVFVNNEAEQVFRMEKPRLWSPETPHLYVAVSKLYVGNQLVDSYETRFGVRSIDYSPEYGFRLNGQTRKFKGVCLHHDLGPLGAAVNTSAIRRQLQILKEMGCDAVRSAHNMPTPELLDLCDEMGFMFMDEAFDSWKQAKVKNGYNLIYDEWVERDLVNMVHRDRNHPCIVMYSTGNEVPEQSSKTGGRVAHYLRSIIHREDPTRPVTAGMDRVDNAINNQFAAALDIPGLNYRLHRYQVAYDRLPQGLILGSETASTVSSRGVYHFPVVQGKSVEHPDGQSSSYDVEACSWSNLPDEDWMWQDDADWVIGEFVWTGFDYLGEPTPYDNFWPSRSSYFGICDLAGLPKDRYYLYKSRWNQTESTLHILPHWNWKGREGAVTPVFVYTSYPEAELFVNGKSQGRLRKGKEGLERYRLMWMDVRYEPGEVKVVAYDAFGQQAESKIIRTSGKPHRIVLQPDRTHLQANGKDLSFVTVSVVDKEGNPCPDATDALTFQVKGAGSFRAVCNGDATSLELFHQPTMKLFSGKLVVLVESSEQIGPIQLTVRGKGLKSADLHLEAVAN